MVNSKKRKKLKRKQIVCTIEHTEELQNFENFETFYDNVSKNLLEKFEKEKERMRLLGYEFKRVKCLEIETF